MKIIHELITINELKAMAEKIFGNFVKAVVDIEKGIMVVDADLHADEEALLIENGSSQQDLWGINLYPELEKKEWIEFDSMINLRPAQGNKSRQVEDDNTRHKIMALVDRLVKE